MRLKIMEKKETKKDIDLNLLEGYKQHIKYLKDNQFPDFDKLYNKFKEKLSKYNINSLSELIFTQKKDFIIDFLNENFGIIQELEYNPFTTDGHFMSILFRKAFSGMEFSDPEQTGEEFNYYIVSKIEKVLENYDDIIKTLNQIEEEIFRIKKLDDYYGNTQVNSDLYVKLVENYS